MPPHDGHASHDISTIAALYTLLNPSFSQEGRIIGQMTVLFLDEMKEQYRSVLIIISACWGEAKNKWIEYLLLN